MLVVGGNAEEDVARPWRGGRRILVLRDLSKLVFLPEIVVEGDDGALVTENYHRYGLGVRGREQLTVATHEHRRVLEGESVSDRRGIEDDAMLRRAHSLRPRVV